jgi:uncharacterized membrane protein
MAKKINKKTVWIIIAVIVVIGFIPMIKVWQGTHNIMNLETGKMENNTVYKRQGLWVWFFSTYLPSVFKDKIRK